MKDVRRKQKLHSPFAKAKKKITSAVCVLGMIAVCLGVVGYQNRLKADEKLPEVTRGVIDQIEQIPETKRTMYDNDASTYKKGTKENPFFILELVPYEEYGSFGYNIGGCEPIDVKRIQGTGHIDTLRSMNMCTPDTGRLGEFVYFFEDEPEAQYSDFKRELDTSVQMHNGYYELVEDGKGAFRQEEDGTIVKAENGNIIWHTIYNKEKELDYPTQTFLGQDEPKAILTTVGDRIYTVRESNESDPVYKVEGYYYYKNSENFLKQSLKLSDEAAANYSVIIKTITPKELNANPKWAKYADLYIVSASCADNAYISMWKSYNRFGRTSTETSYVNSFENTDGQKDRDITWKVAKQMYDKITGEKNGAAIMMTANSYKVSKWTSVTMSVFDWNLKLSGDTYPYNASNNNMYKLTVMLLSLNESLFKKLYWDADAPLITEDGKFTLQTGDAQEYWNMFTFLPTNARATDPEVNYNWYGYWTSSDKWKDYQIAGNIEANRRYVNNRIYIGGDGGDILRDYLKNGLNLKDTEHTKYTDFNGKDYMNGADSASPSDAIHYILGKLDSGDDKIKGDLNILDIEPSYDYDNGFSLTKNYIYVMMPHFDGNVNITHMTTSEFIGTTQDLNSTYNMIFMGLDDGGFNKDWSGKTVWNDESMNGKIYFHTGDKAYGSNWDNVNFVTNNNSNEMRFAGNDITKLKRTELENFLSAGYPIVAVPNLYKLDSTRIDKYSNIYDFVKDNKGGSKALYITEGTDADGNSSVTLIENAVKQTRAEVEWSKLPNIYNGETTGEKSSMIADANYLETNTDGRSLLPFAFTIKDTEKHTYNYRIYIDQNRDSKFDEDEIFDEGDGFTVSDAELGKTIKKTLKVSQLFVGLIQWKVEVYRVDNEQIHFSQTGCSAAKNQTGTKIKIKVLQIDPDPKKKYDYQDDDQGKLDLSSNDLFKQYSSNLTDYEISVTRWTVEEYKNHFTWDHPFKFDYSKEVSTEPGNENPKNSQKQIDEIYSNFDMIIVGFGDSYGSKDITNEYGAVDFLEYFAAKGKSILFTHDFTSMNNGKNNNEDNKFGYTANKLLRDLMGMNRYQAVSKDLGYNNGTGQNEYTTLTEYQKQHTYDYVQHVNGPYLNYKQGFTYYAMKDLAVNTTGNMPYRSLPKKYFNNDGDLTMTASKTNDGQITQYPYKIGSWTVDASTGKNVFDASTLSIAKTHAQWYQLNMEDPEVTVWYCLADGQNDELEKLQQANSWVGSPAIYGVSPNDVANNYYIYSKNNIYYSGVGHSTVTGDVEMKLLINTIIGAYRQVYEAPIVEVLNSEADQISRSPLKYTMDFNQEYDNDSVQVLSDKAVDTSNEGAGSDEDTDMVKVRFSPVELNTIITRLSFSIYYTSGEANDKTYITTIYHEKGDGTVEVLKTDASKNWIYEDTMDSNGKYTKHIKSMDEYYFYYPKAYLSDNWKDTSGNTHEKRNEITFEIKNNKVKESGYTDLGMQSQFLFLLD